MPIFLSWQEFISGWIGGVSGLLCSHPFDTIKVKHQDGQSTLIEIFKITYKEEGIGGYYKGIAFPAIMAGTQNAIFFGVNSNILRLFVECSDTDDSLLEARLISGCCAGFMQVLFTTPIEIIKIKLQTSSRKLFVKNPYSTMIKTIEHIHTSKGIAGFYRGFIPTALRDVPSGGLYITLYAYGDKWLQQYISEYWSHMLAGGIAGMTSYAPFIPFDVIKTRLQADNVICPEYEGFFDCAIKSYKKDGITCFWKGMGPFCLRGFTCNAAVFVVYELCMELLP